MKKNPSLFSTPRRGFTLVELLVVIVIIAVLASFAFTMGPKMKRKADATKSVQNMRQIGALMGTFATDNNFRLPAPRSEVSATQIHWHQSLLLLVYPDLDEKKLNDLTWWKQNDPVLHNPLMTEKSKPLSYQPWFPGYAFNREIISNLGMDNGDWSPGKGGPQTKGVLLAQIPDPGRTPIVIPRHDWHYVSNDLKDRNLEPFLVEGKLPVLFIDGHVEQMKPQEYIDRELGNMPPRK